MKKNTLADIEAKLVLDPETGCEEWAGARTPQGYGVVSFGGRLCMVHRLRYEKYRSEALPPEVIVRHTCDNPPCAALGHLVEGSHVDNMQDMRDRGRMANRRGEGHCRAKLTEADVLAIRADGRTQQAISEAYGVSRPLVSDIRRRKRWAHI